MRKKIIASCILISLLAGIFDISTYAKASDIQKRDFANVVLFAHFSGNNASSDAAYFANKTNRDKIIKYYNGEHGRSMKNYLKTVSYGKFEIHNIFPQDNGTAIKSCQLSMSEKEAQEKNVDSMVIEQVLKQVPGISDQLIDYDRDGIIDNLTVIMKGEPPSSSSSTNIPTLVSHKSNFPSSSVKWSNKSIGTYNMLSTDRVLDQESGVIIHEFLHTLGYPDLYRGDSKDPKEPCNNPVHIWDVMASASSRVSYPLAYNRMKFTNWLDIETIKESRKNLVLDMQDKASGNQAYILQSPLNEHELFVIEYRKAGARYTSNNQYNEDSLDASLYDDKMSGIIVYRINTTVTELSNYRGQTGIYVFRPQKGQNGYETNADGSCNEKLTVMNAALSDQNGRTSIGHEDLDKKLEDGALTFSDGTNSGIVISNVKRNSDGSQMTLDVSVPNGADFDLWKDTGFADSSSGEFSGNKNTAITSCNGMQYLVTYNPTAFTSGNFQLYNYKNNGWTALGNKVQVSGGLSDKKLFSYKNELYLAYITNQQKLYIKKCSGNGSWTDILTGRNNVGSDLDIKETTQGLYITYAEESSRAVLGKIENNNFTVIGKFFENLCGQPKVCEMNGKIYTAVRDASTGNTIKVFRYDGNSNFTEVDNGSFSGNTYDMVSLDGKIYIPLGGSDLKMASYDGKNWKTGNSSGISAFEPSISVTQGNLYVLVSSTSGEGNTKVYQYDTGKDSYVQEGLDVGSAGQSISLTSSDNKLFISYVQKLDNKIIIKTKKTANELLSLTIVPPNILSYFKGDKVDSTGIKVTANYTKESREIAAGAYTITGFDTNTVGQRAATVKYGGKQNSFYYEVLDGHEHNFSEWKTIQSLCQSDYRERVCESCGYKETEGFEEGSHNWANGVVKAATCTQKGIANIYCKNCEIEKEQTEIPLAGHKYVTATNKATTSRNGSVVTACSVCRKENGRTVISYPKTVTLSGTSYTYSGKAITPSVTVKDSAGKTIAPSNYMVYYPGGRKAIGQYAVNIVFKGNYSGSVQKTFSIGPKGTNISKLSKGKKKMTVKWKKQKSQISGYEIQYSLKKNFSSGTKAKTASKKKTSVKISKLKPKKKYYVRIRTYKTVKYNGRSIKVYSAWSKTKSVKVQ